jgi:hypothetical protein
VERRERAFERDVDREIDDIMPEAARRTLDRTRFP